jgi:hypothetical protein
LERKVSDRDVEPGEAFGEFVADGVEEDRSGMQMWVGMVAFWIPVI